MAWIRKGSPCIQPHRPEWACGQDPCPGSDVYVFEHTSGGIACCMCDLSESAFGEFRCATATEMVRHLRAHVAAGHHLPSELLDVGRLNGWLE